jgi:hypothetical protein
MPQERRPQLSSVDRSASCGSGSSNGFARCDLTSGEPQREQAEAET